MTILILDVETSGKVKNFKIPPSVSDNYPEVVELAAVLCAQNGRIIRSYSVVIEREEVGATDIHGITGEMSMKFGSPIFRAMRVLQDTLLPFCDVVVCHNYRFDIGVLNSEFLRLGWKTIDKPVICTMQDSVNKFVGIPSPYGQGNFKWCTLGELHQTLFDSLPVDQHDALSDVMTSRRCYFELVKRGIQLNEIRP